MIDYRTIEERSMTVRELEALEASRAALYATESDWQLQNGAELQLPAEQMQAIGLRQIVCPFCDTGNNTWPLFKGAVTGCLRAMHRTCHCVIYKRFYPEFISNVPVHDRGVSLKTLSPSGKSRLHVDYQENVIAHLQKHPADSYAFFGPAGCSKTTYSVALYKDNLLRAVYSGERFGGSISSVVRVSAKALMDDFVAAATGSVTKGKVVIQQPALSARKIKQIVSSGRVPRLFLSEIDKVSYTDFKTNCLFEVIDGLYENEGQLVLDTNVPQDQLSSLFVGATGEALMRRICEMCKPYDLFQHLK